MAKKNEEQTAEQATPAHFEEWKMEWVDGEPVKLKKTRDVVKITEEEAETLNSSASPATQHPTMYFRPE